METENTEVVPAEGIEATNVEPTPSSEPTLEATPPPETLETPEGVEGAEAGAPEWTPNFGFKVRDEEHKMDEWVQPFIKDPETEKKFQDLYTRGHGLDLAKTERDEYKQKLGNLEESLQTVNELVQQGKAEDFIKALGLPEKMFMDWAEEKQKFLSLPPEQQQKIAQQQQQNLAFQTLEQQNSSLQEQVHQEAAQRRSMELENALGTDYKSHAEMYDQRAGKPGAFRQLVVDRGIFHSHVNGVDIPVAQAVQEAILLGGVQAGTQPTQQPVVSGTPTVQPQRQNKPVLPNLQSQGTSPTKTTFSSIDQIRAHAKKNFG